MKLLLVFGLVSIVSSYSEGELPILYPPQFTSDSRIVGGENAEDGQAPFQCSMQSNKRHFCGCALISSEWIVTASHCVSGQRPEQLEILVGTNNLKEGGTYYKVENYVKHPKFNKPNFANDIALMRVKGSITLNKSVQSIEFSPNEVPENSTLQLTGWGRLKANGALPQQLQIINLKSISTKNCKKIYNNRNVHDSHLCTFNKRGQGACNGDSGGPLVFDNKLVGIVNWGVPCAAGFPDAFAKVSYLYEWLQETITNNSSTNGIF